MEDAIQTRADDREVFRATVTALIILLASWAIDYFLQVKLGGWLGEEDYGDYSVAVSLALLITYFCGLGTEESLPRFLPTYRATGRLDQLIGFLRAHLTAILVVSIVIAAAGMLFFLSIGRYPVDHPISIIWWLIPPLALAEFFYTTLNNLERILSSAFIQQIGLPLSTLIATSLFVLLEGRLTDYRSVTAYGMAAGLLVPIYTVILFRTVPREIWKVRPHYELGLWFKTAVPMVLSTLAYYALGQVDVYAMESVGREEDVGILVACTKTADFVFLSYSAAYLVMASRISPLAEHGRLQELRAMVRNSVRAMLGLSSVIAVVFVVFGRSVLGWFGHGFAAGYGPMLVLVLANIPLSAMSISWPLLSLSGHEKVPVPGLFVSIGLLYGASLLLIPHFGLLGAVISKAGVSFLLFAWLSWQLRRRVGVGVWEIFNLPPRLSSVKGN